MATPSYHPKVLRAIEALMRCHARQEVKDQLRARNQRVTDYDPRDISIMARELLQSKPEVFPGAQRHQQSSRRLRRSLLLKLHASLHENLNIRATQEALRCKGFE
jgi:hypothetical protein